MSFTRGIPDSSIQASEPSDRIIGNAICSNDKHFVSEK
ncbi:MAG: hypothetical protein BWY05_01604 [Euryarchaeota archaeon ADurb.Bin165]|nr:MAG: hypothetical protein BWY05_01604 [Euryarchaeota archaeon ADurb.Bin165]